MSGLAKVLKYVETSSTSATGKDKYNNRASNYPSDPLVIEQHVLLLGIYCILRRISVRLREIAIRRADSLVDYITTTNDCRNMFQAC